MNLFLLVYAGVSRLSKYQSSGLSYSLLNRYFYISQTSISAGRILRMGKGFTIEGVEGHDLAALFLEAFRRKVNSERVL